MRKISLSPVIGLIVGIIGLWVVPATAHHSFSMFDKTKEITISGTVSLFQWMNPHTYIWIYVPNEKGSQDLWGIEGVGPSALARRGWDKHTINQGDKVSIVINPLKDGRPGGAFVKLTLTNGKPFVEPNPGAD